jgi:hypothetical protein
MRVSEIESAGRRQAPVPGGVEQVREGGGEGKVQGNMQESRSR